MPNPSNKSVGAKPKYTWWHGLRLGFIWELPQDHGKVMSRSQQGQISSKQSKVAFFVVFLQLCLLEMSMKAWNLSRLQQRPIPKHHESL